MARCVLVVAGFILISSCEAACPSGASVRFPQPLWVTGGASTKKNGDWVCEGDVCKLKSEDDASEEDTEEDTDSTHLLGHSSSLIKKLKAFLGVHTKSTVVRLLNGTGGLFAMMQAELRKAFSTILGKPAKAPSKAGKNTPKAGMTSSSVAVSSKATAKPPRGGNKRRQNAGVRIMRELGEFQKNAPEHCSVAVRDSNVNVWIITLTGVTGTLFANEKYKLRVEFPRDYPAKPPSVYFLKPTPRHPHVYTNGDICLDLLGKGWKPQITVRTLAISILSMLSSAKEKGIPPDNCNHADSAPGRPQHGWLYHDDHC